MWVGRQKREGRASSRRLGSFREAVTGKCSRACATSESLIHSTLCELTRKIAVGESGHDERFDSAPQGIVVLDLDVRLHECAGKPAIAGAGDGIALVAGLI